MNYIDAFVLPIPAVNLEAYQKVAQSVADIWIEHGALNYFEYVGDDLYLEGTRAFPDFIKVSEDEAVIFGWVVFASREKRDEVNRLVAGDPRMENLVAPLVNPEALIFDAGKMVFGGFRGLVTGGVKRG